MLRCKQVPTCTKLQLGGRQRASETIMLNDRYGQALKNPVLLVSILAVLVVMGLGVGYLSDISNRPISVTGTLQAKEIRIASKVGGRIAKVLVQEGQLVHDGQALVEFEVPELEARRQELLAIIAQNEAQLLELQHGPRPAEIDKAQAAMQMAFNHWQMLKRGYRQEEIGKAKAQRLEAERNLALLKSGYRKEEVAQARELMEQSKSELDWIVRDRERYQALAEQGAVSTRDSEQLKAKENAALDAYQAAQQAYQKMKAGPRVDEIRAATERLNVARNQETMMTRGPRNEEIEMARQEYLQAQSVWSLLKQGTRIEVIKRSEAQLAQAKAQLAQLDAQLKDRQVHSPADAEVSVMDLHAGEVYTPNKPLATLTRLDTIWTRVYIPERELGRIAVGQAVTVKVDAYPHQQFRGKVVQIPGVAEFTPRNVQTPEERSAQVFAIKINVENPEHILRGGMNAEITLPPTQGVWGKTARKLP